MGFVFVLLCIMAGGSASAGEAAREPLEVKLIGGSQYSGRLAVKVGDTWGTVCDVAKDWDDENAEVACRHLGLEGGYLHETNLDLYPLPTDAHYPFVMMADVGCTGDEISLGECDYERRADPECEHDDDVVLTCEPPGATSTVRLIGGDGASGRLAINYVGTWGTVCEDTFDDYEDDEDTEAAQVVCRELGLSGGRRGSQGANNSLLFPWPAGVFYSTIWPEIISCDGDEQKLEECYQDSWGNHSCDHSKDVYIFCDVPIETPDLAHSQFVLDIGFGYSASKCVTVNSTEHPDGYHCDQVLTSNPELPQDFTISYKGTDQVCVQRADGGKAWDGQWVRLVCSSGCGRGGSGPSGCGGGSSFAGANFVEANAPVWNSAAAAAAIVLCLCAALLALRAKQAKSKEQLVGADPCGSPRKTLLILQRRLSISKDPKSELV